MVGEPAEIEVAGLVWEYGPKQNVEHFAGHDVSPADVHAALASEPLFFENLPGRTATHVMVGPDSRGRILYVALLGTDARGIWKPISGWESRLARRIYSDKK